MSTILCRGKKVALRDGPRCCISGAIHNVTVVQLIPMSDDLERFVRV